MFEVSSVEEYADPLTGNVGFCFLYSSKSLYLPPHMLAPGHRVRGSSVIDLRRLLGVGRCEFVHEVSEHLVAHDEMAHSNGCTGIHLCRCTRLVSHGNDPPKAILMGEGAQAAAKSPGIAVPTGGHPPKQY